MTWYDADYSYKKKITIQAGQVAGDEVDFPVLISTTDADLKDEANGGHVKSPNGYDIIFTNGIETIQLKHEIESYEKTTGEIIYWVKVPSISGAVNTDIYMYYGKTGVIADPSTSDTWDGNFEIVYHLKEAAGNAIDSTANGNDGTVNGCTQFANGKIGKCYSYDGVLDYVFVDDFWTPTNTETITMWFKCDDLTKTDDRIVTFTTHTRNDTRIKNPQVIHNGTFDRLSSIYRDAEKDAANCFQDNVITDTNWHFLVNRLNIQTMSVYLDGVFLCNDTDLALDAIASNRLVIGADYEDNTNNFSHSLDGRIDEFRLSKSVRSVNWTETEYNGMNAPDTFLIFGPEETPPSGAGHKYHITIIDSKDYFIVNQKNKSRYGIRQNKSRYHKVDDK